jgi:hypothetical protein
MTPEFTTPADCIRARMERATHTPAMVGAQPDELQRHCQTCQRWTYAYARCNLFKVSKAGTTDYDMRGGN